MSKNGLFVKTEFFIAIWDSEPAGIWTRISGIKIGYVTIELHSIDIVLKFIENV